MMMDIALCLDELTPAAKYMGSVTANDRAAYDAVKWQDERPKPDWGDILARWDEIKNRPAPVKIEGITVEEVAARVARMEPEHEDLKQALPGVLQITKTLKQRQDDASQEVAALKEAVPSVLNIGRETKRILDDLKEQTE